MVLQKNVTKAEAQEHWHFVQNTAERVSNWPDWKQNAVRTSFCPVEPEDRNPDSPSASVPASNRDVVALAR